MELILGVLSLMWVIGLFSLQRIDNLIDDYYSDVAYYLSINSNGVIDKIQLEVISKIPKNGIDSYLNSRINQNSLMNDKNSLVKSKKFLSSSAKVKFFLEIILVAVTILVPVVYFIDFSNTPIITILDKSWLLYVALFIVSTASILIERILLHYSRDYQLVKIKAGPEDQDKIK